MKGFIKLIRCQESFDLMKDYPAFLLLSQIAIRAVREDRTIDINGAPISLLAGQALIGDYLKIGLTRQQYRTAQKHLSKRKLATFNPTNKGTIATLLNNSVFDINCGHTNQQPNHQTTNRQPLTRRYKNEKNIYTLNTLTWNEDAYISVTSDDFDEYIRIVKRWLNSAPDDYWSKLEHDYPNIDVQNEAQKALDWLINNPVKRVLYINRFFLNWYKKAGCNVK